MRNITLSSTLNQPLTCLLLLINPPHHSADFEEYTIITDTKGLEIVENKEGLPWQAFIGILGMPGEFLLPKPILQSRFLGVWCAKRPDGIE